MARVALLIGTERYGDGFKSLPAAPKDVTAWADVLRNPEMGGFEEVQTLIDPAHSDMAQKIEAWFRSHTKEDLALLFISGHGIKDNDRKLYFAASDSRIEKDVLMRSTAVGAEFVRDRIRESRSKRQIIILDCCFSGAFGDLLAKDDGSVNLETILGAEGRVVLTSSNSTQSSFEQRDGNLSIYTRYLIEGIRTGAADLDDDGAITVDELHEFASRKVQEESPAMNPQIIVLKQEGYRIRIANVAMGDPTVKYRKEVEAIVLENEGEIDELMDRPYLDELRQSLAIELLTAIEIEFEVLEPIRQRNAKIAKYREVFSQAIERRYPLNERDQQKLKRLQKVLGLRDEDIFEIESPIVRAKEIAITKQVERSAQIITETSRPIEPTQSDSEDDLQSEKGMDYTPLRDLLKARKWKEADQETRQVMCAVMGREKEGWLREEDAQSFPCADLRTIDQLWVKYSEGRFGFSVQKRIYVETGNPLDGEYYKGSFERFGDRVGWRMKAEWISYFAVTFDTSSPPEGHLPLSWLMSGVVRWGVVFSSLAQRLVNCSTSQS